MGGDGEGVEEAEGVSWVEGEGEEVGALCFVADREREGIVRMGRGVPGRASLGEVRARVLLFAGGFS